MAHRIYLYNLDQSTHQREEGYLGEWNYVIPELFAPLFSAQPRAKGSALYFDKEEGVQRLRQFYDLLTETYKLQENQAFSTAVAQLFEFLFDLPFDTFYIDGSDVYSMNEECPKEQAKQWVAEIKDKWLRYEQALAQRDLSCLDDCIQAAGYASFLEALQHDWVKYGLGYWEEHALKKSRAAVFKEGDLWGLKDKKGKVLVAATYTCIHEFSDAAVAVVEQNGKFGYLNEQGELVLPLIYDEAFDAAIVNQTKVGIACLEDKRGLIHIATNTWGILPVYDEVEQLYGQYYNVKQNGTYQVVDYTGKVIVAERSLFPFEFAFPLTFFTQQEQTAKCRYYTLKGQGLGEYPVDVLAALPLDYYWVKPNQYQKKICVLHPSGEVLLDNIDQILVFSEYTSFAYKVNKQWKLFDCKQNRPLLEELVLDKIHANYLCHYLCDAYVIQTSLGVGLYHAAQDRWLIEIAKDNVKIEHVNQQLVRIKEKQGMRYYNFQTDELSARYVYICEPIDYANQQACLFEATQLYTIDREGNRQEVSPEDMGNLYEQRYNLRGKDLAFFTAFYEAWIERVGEQYDVYFDLDTLYYRGMAAKEEEDWSTAVRYFSIGANRKDPRMLYELGLIYTDDNAWTAIPKGIAYLEEAAAQEYADAWNTIGYLYQNSIGYAYDVDAMIDAYKKAVELGCVWANQNLGDLYFYGELVEQDYDQALSYYVLSEKHYGDYAQNLLEIHYQRRDFDQVLKYLRRNTDQPYSHIYYGILYDHGYGVKQSEKKAIAHYEQALAYSSYFYAVTRLFYYYGEHPKFKNEEAFQKIVDYAALHEIDTEEDK